MGEPVRYTCELVIFFQPRIKRKISLEIKKIPPKCRLKSHLTVTVYCLLSLVRNLIYHLVS